MHLMYMYVQVFADFVPSALFPEQCVQIIRQLGDGGYGTVSLGLLTTKVVLSTL